MSTKRKYGYIKSKPRPHHVFAKFTEEHAKAFHESKSIKYETKDVFDLRTIVTLPQALSNMDQGQLGSCSANAIAFAYAFDEIKQKNAEVFMPSRLFIYYNERVIEGTVDEDSGAQISDGMDSINKTGVCMEAVWPYDISQFTVQPSAEAYTQAKLAKTINYVGLDFSDNPTIADRVEHIKTALKSGFPIIFGFLVYEEFESEQVATTGMVPMPKPGEQPIGGHAVCAVGFDDNKQCFIVKNSWGPNWGLNGYFYMPYAYLGDPNQASEFWIIRSLTNPNNIPNYNPSDINPDPNID